MARVPPSSTGAADSLLLCPCASVGVVCDSVPGGTRWVRGPAALNAELPRGARGPGPHRKDGGTGPAHLPSWGRVGPNPTAGTLEWSCEKTDQGEARDQGQRRSHEPGHRGCGHRGHGGQPLADLRRVSAPRDRDPTRAPRLPPPDTCRSRTHAALPLGRCRSARLGERGLEVCADRQEQEGASEEGAQGARDSPGWGRSPSGACAPGQGTGGPRHRAFRTAVPEPPLAGGVNGPW